MNERIRELYEQAYESKPVIVVDPATGQPVHCTGHNGKPMYHRELNLEKFAELIVRDVLIICNAVSEPFEDPEMDKNIPGALVVAEMVRENFGVLK